MKVLAIGAGLSAMLFFSSCATLNKDQCLNANWQDLGLKDGSMGFANTRVADHRKACAEYGVVPNENAYKKGHKVGIRVFCTPQKGFEIGRAGGMASTTCPSDLAPAFYAAVDRGRSEYQADMARREEENRAQAREALRRQYFAPPARGGLCDASRSAGICYVFAGQKYVEHPEQRTNRMVCNMLGGDFSPTGQCPEVSQLGRCTIQQGSPGEYMIYYYAKRHISSVKAQGDCADPHSSIHVQGSGAWTPVP